MSDKINEELLQLASEFTAARESKNKNRYPAVIWEKAIKIANKFTIPIVCEAINVNPIYFRKKVSDLNLKNSDDSLDFFEIQQNKCKSISELTIKIETSCGNLLRIEGASPSSLIPIINEFLHGGKPCFK